MEIRTAVYVISSPAVEQCPPPDKPEFAFIGRSNVGKSSMGDCSLLTMSFICARDASTNSADIEQREYSPPINFSVD